MLYNIAQYCTILHNIAQYCTILQNIAQYCNGLQLLAVFCNILYFSNNIAICCFLARSCIFLLSRCKWRTDTLPLEHTKACNASVLLSEAYTKQPFVIHCQNSLETKEKERRHVNRLHISLSGCIVAEFYIDTLVSSARERSAGGHKHSTITLICSY